MAISKGIQIMDKSIAVVIPVYNGAPFIDRCLTSMIEQKELTEIIVVDDGSTDDSVAMIIAFANKDNRITLLQHKDNSNLGRSASRNLGIKSASSEWITFCDVDDYYLPNRFEQFRAINLDNIDGTHEPVLSEYKNQSLDSSLQEITATTKSFDQPFELQDFLISNREERISIISLIIRKSKIEEVGYFDEGLKIGEDTDLIWRLASISKLQSIPTNPPKVIRGVHDHNTYQDQKEVDQARKIFYNKWMTEMEKYELSDSAKSRITESYHHYNDHKLSKLKLKLGKLLKDV